MGENADQDFEAAWAEASGEQAAAPNSGAAVPGTGPSQAAEPTRDTGAGYQPPEGSEASQPDIWATVPDEARAAYQAAVLEKERLEHMRRSDEGRVSRFQAERDELRQKLDALSQAAEQEDLKAYLESDGYKRAKQDYGDDLGSIFQTLEALVNRTQSTEQQLAERFSTIDEVTRNAETAQVIGIVTERASDWQDLMFDPGFSSWVETQPAFVQDMIARNADRFVDPDEVVDVFDRFRAYRAGGHQPPSSQTDPRRAAQLDGSKTVRTKAPSIVGDDDGSFEGYWKQAATQADKRIHTTR